MRSSLNVILLLVALLIITNHEEIGQNSQNKCTDQKGEKILISASALNGDEETIKNIFNKQASGDTKTILDALNQRQIFQQRYVNQVRSKNAGKNNRIPERTHRGQHFNNQDRKKGRLLTSTNNQYTGINQGNSDQVTDGNYVYSLRYQNLTIHRVQGAKLIKISEIVYTAPLFPAQIHAARGYFAVIFYLYNPNATVIKIYQNSGNSVTETSQFKSEGLYIASRQYNSYLLIFSQGQMKKQSLDYQWTVNGKNVSSKVYQGMSANKTANNLGNAARYYAKIYMGPGSSSNYRFATFIFCDYAFNIIMTPGLNVITAGNYYNYTSYAVSFQLFSFYEKSGQTWGSSKWVIYPGLVNNDYQMHEYNNYFRVVLVYTEGQLATKGHISIAKLPISSFDPNEGSIYHQLGIQGQIFVASRFRKDGALLIFADGTIKTFSSSFGIFMDTINVNKKILYIYPYGTNDLIGFGTTQSGNDVGLVRFGVSGYKLTYKQSISLKSSAFSYSEQGWFSNQFIQLDWKTKLITFPIFSSQKQPYRSGYYQIYANPLFDCMSSLPVPNPCPNNIQNQALIAGKAFKHWDNTTGYDWNTGPSEQIRRSSTISAGGVVALITGSSCQIQAKIIKSPFENPIRASTNSSQITFYDLCS